jgi:Zn-dependent peptidase ImmA (M78 family)/transcriptional regulator with XRE-family HTH domain
MINYEMVVLAREYRNLTQEELARRISVTQGSISKIEGNMAPDKAEELIGRIAVALDFPVEFFYQPGERLGFGSSAFYYRKRAVISSSDRKRISGVVNLLRLSIKRLLNSVELEPNRALPQFSLDDFGGSAAHIARALRGAWNLPEGPINNLTALVESAGVIVVPCDFGSNAMDATSLRLADMPPLIFISKAIPGDRWRFTLAHELAHLVMHTVPSETMEDEADTFAAEFLMPESELRAQFLRYPKIRLQDLANLKPYWKVSMAALLVRAKTLGNMSDAQSRSAWMQMASAGYKMKEPIPLPVEAAQNFEQMFQYFLKDLGYTVEEMARLMFMNPEEFSRLGVDALSPKIRPLRLVAVPSAIEA